MSKNRHTNEMLN